MDSSGQERFRPLNEQYYNHVDSIILVYDIANLKTFIECKKYFCKKIKEKCKKILK